MKKAIKRILSISLCVAMLAATFLSPLGVKAEETVAPTGFEDWTPYLSDKVRGDIPSSTTTKSMWNIAFENGGEADAEGMIAHGWDGNNSGMIYSNKRYTDFEMTFDYYSVDDIYIGIGASEQGNTYSNQASGLYSLMVGWKGYALLRKSPTEEVGWISGDISDTEAFKNAKHSMKIRVVDKKITVYISENADGNWNERGTRDISDYNGGYIYLASFAYPGRFSAPKVKELDLSQIFVNKAFKDFTPYNVEAGDNHFGGTSTKMDNYDLWQVWNDKEERENLMTSCQWQDGSRAGYMFSNEKYTNFELTMQYYVTTSWNRFWLGIGSSELGKAPIQAESAGTTVFQFNSHGVVEAKTDGTVDNINGGWAYTDETQYDLHTIRLVVYNGHATVYLLEPTYEGQGPKRLEFDLGENYHGGHIFIKSWAPEARFSAPKIENLDKKNFDASMTADLNSYSSASTDVFKATGLTKDTDLSDNWYCDSQGLIHKLPNGRLSVLYLNSANINNHKKITFKYKSARSAHDLEGLFIGVGAKDMGGNFYNGDSGTSNPQILRVWNKGWIQTSPRWYNNGNPVDGWVDKVWEFEGTDRDATHTMTLEIKYKNIYIWIDGRYYGTHAFCDFATEDSYLFLGGWDSAIAFSVPEVTNINLTPQNLSDGYKDQSVLFIGDSISSGALDRAAWAERLAFNYGLRINNASQGGAILAEDSAVYQDGNTLPMIQKQLRDNMNDPYNYVVVEGGINDIFWNQRGREGNVTPGYCELGTISDSFDSDSFAAQNTFAGGLERIFYNITQMKDSNGNTPKAAFIMVYKPTWGYQEEIANQYVDVVKQLCMKWGVKLINFWDDEVFNQLIRTEQDDKYLKTPYLPDGLHVSYDGYNEMYKIIGDQKNGVLQTATVPCKASIITVTARTETGTEVTANLQGGGMYQAGGAVNVIAPAEDPQGYQFIGWYEGDERVSTEKTYTFEAIAGQKRAFVAKYKAVGEGTIKVVDGTTETTETKTLGQSMTVSATGSGFLHWTNRYGMIVSTTAEYTFTVVTSDTLTANYESDEQKSVVVWQSGYGQVMLRGEYTATDDITEPATIPSKIGYTATDWKLTIEEIKTKIQNGDKLITVEPNYILDQSSVFTIEATHGTLNKSDGKYGMNDLVIATADIIEGKTFSYWKNAEDGSILGYSQVYRFYATQDYRIEAVYDEIVTAQGTASIVQVLRDTDAKKLSFVAMLTVPDGCTIVSGGVLITRDSNKAINITRDNADLIREMAYEGTALRYTWTVKDTNVDEVWYVRPYVMYRDANGVLQEILGNMEMATVSGNATSVRTGSDETPAR